MDVNSLYSKVRAYLNDVAAKNRLLGGVDEFELEDVIKSSELALEEINYKGIYKTGYTMETCDPYLLRLGTAMYLLSGVIATKTRNYATVNDGGVTVNREGNIDLYYRMHDSIKQEFEDQLYAKKNASSLLNGFGY